MKFKKSRLVSLSNLKFIFSIFCGVTLRRHYIIKAAWSVIQKELHSMLEQSKIFYFLAIKTSAQNMKSKKYQSGNTS